MNVMRQTRNALQALLAAAAACVGLAAPATALAYDDGWRNCAEEGETCTVPGRAVVRFGVNGRWISRTVSNSVECNTEAFGDPVPQLRKRCQVRVSGSDESGNFPPTSRGWSFCAAEGEMCRFQGKAEVRFGQGNNFVTRTAYDSVRCDVADFGDPIHGVTKFCEVRHSGDKMHPNSSQGSWHGWTPDASTSGWRYCAPEGGTCRVQGSATVRFGDGRSFKSRKVKGAVSCDVGTFGDPAYGIAKHCEVQAANHPDSGSSGWTQCAREGERCNFSGVAQLRFGTAGRYVYRDATNGVTCASNYFGNDPYPNRVKACEIKR